MQLEVGDRIPFGSFMNLDLPKEGCALGRPQKLESSSIFDGKLVVLVAVPGAFTPTCSEKHIPAFISHFDEFRSKGVDTVVCLSTNDCFVQAYWARQINADGKLLMLADGNGDWIKSAGLELDLKHLGMGVRSQRFAAIVKDGIVKYLGVDQGPVLKSSAETVLANLPRD